VSYGSSWAEMNELNQTLPKAHCDGRLTFVRYEMLRAMRRAARHARLERPQVERIFWDNGVELVEAVRRDLDRVLGPARG
jgi:glutamate-1-semialdehyde 2,1-aminomutase